MGLDIHINAKHGNPQLGTGRGIQWGVWASALLLENTNTGVFALIFHFLGCPVRNNVPQPMAHCCKDEAHSSCSTIGKKDHRAMTRCCLARKPSLWVCPGAVLLPVGNNSFRVKKKIKIEMCSSLKWCCDASWVVILVLPSCPDLSCICLSEGEHHNHKMLRSWKGS